MLTRASEDEGEASGLTAHRISQCTPVAQHQWSPMPARTSTLPSNEQKKGRNHLKGQLQLRQGKVLAQINAQTPGEKIVSPLPASLYPQAVSSLENFTLLYQSGSSTHRGDSCDN